MSEFMIRAGTTGLIRAEIAHDCWRPPGLFAIRRTMGICQPTARRPIANIFRLTANGATRFCVRTRISPDAISYFSIVAAAAAAACFWQSAQHPALLLVAPLFCALRLWCN
ncbi:MAG TPA: hypothetical protein VGI85_06030, partial [Chthoniobacterales bacterium]